MTTKKVVPSFATHPGTILADEIEANNFSQIDFANLIDIKRSLLNEIIKGKKHMRTCGRNNI